MPARDVKRHWETFPRWKRIPASRTWHFEVYNTKGEVVLYDNTNDYKKILNSALIRVEALRHMEIAGHRLKPYQEV